MARISRTRYPEVFVTICTRHRRQGTQFSKLRRREGLRTVVPNFLFCRQTAQKRRVHCTSINGESWLLVYGFPGAQRFRNGIVKDKV